MKNAKWECEDFIHKLGIALKEVRESRTWIKLIIQADLLPEQRMSELLDEANQLCNIIGKSVVTAKANQTLGNRSSTSSHTET